MTKHNNKNSDFMGHIRLRKDGRWEGQYYFTGERKSIYGKTEEEVRAKINQIYADIINQTHIEESHDTVEAWLTLWLRQYAKPTVRPSTYTSYETYINKHITPILGTIKLRHLRTERLQEFFNEKAINGRLNGRGGLAQKTLLNMRNMLHEALTQACTNALLINNPVSGVKLSSPSHYEQRVLSEDEAKKLLEVVEQSNHPVAKGIIILLKCGLRKGELLGLQWPNVNMNDASILIRKTLSRMKHPDKTQTEYERLDLSWARKGNRTGLYLGPVKSYKGNRKIYLPKKALSALQELQQIQGDYEARLKSSAVFNPGQFILCSSLGRPLDTKYFEEWFDKFIKKAGLERTNIHATRHTFATQALRKSKDINTVSDILGHAKPSTTLDMYGHTFDDKKKQLMDSMDD